jgi:hypothetical protein
MNFRELLSDSSYVNQTQLAERELSAFIAAVTQLFGPEQARISTEDWLEVAELMDRLPRPPAGNWRAVTIAASARLANRIDAASSPGISDKAS